MKLLSTMLAAAFVAGSCTVAMAQGSASGAGGANESQQAQPNNNADKNPTGPAAKPSAGNTASPGTGAGGQRATKGSGAMKTAPVSNTNDATGAKTGEGGVK